MENCMDELQELLQRTETIQKINALQEHAAVEIFSWPAYSGKDRLKRGIRKYLLRQAVPPMDRYSWPNALLAGGLSQVQKVTRDSRSSETLKNILTDGFGKGCLFIMWIMRQTECLCSIFMRVREKRSIWRPLPALPFFEGTQKR